MMIRRNLLIALVLCCLGSSGAQARDLTVFAAASLKEPVDAMAAQFGDVQVTYAGSGLLARQIMLGAPADVVMLANVAWMDALDEGGHISPDSRADFAGNALVLVSAGPTPVALSAEGIAAALGPDGRLAIGLVASVPAGIYAKSAFEDLGLWPGIAARLAEVDNVRAALALVARGAAPLGVVYATDARVAPELHVVANIPQQAHPPIRYTLGLIGPDPHPQAAAFAAFVTGADGQDILGDAGFLPVQVRE